MSYQPASVLTTTAGLSHLASIYYDRVAVENLKANLPFVAVTSRRKLPDRNGRVIQLYGYDLFAANTTPGTEGTVGTGINPTTSVRNVAVNQYFDFASFSDILVETAIDPIVENTAAEMGYRAALTANTLARTEFEAEATADSTIVISCTDNEFLSASLTRQAVMSLRGADVRPQTDGLFAGIIHPFAAFDLSRGRNLPNSVNHSSSKNRAKPTQVGMCRDYIGEAKSQEIVRTAWRHAELRGNTVATQKCGVTDCLNDNTAGGVIDILKYHKEGSEELMRGVQGYRVIDVAGARFIETTTASTFASFPSGTKTGYGTYVVGQDAVFSVSLGATEIPEQRNSIMMDS
jgi:hypothetical protein